MTDAADRARQLLLDCQDRVYNICFQVLRHPQDAEDAAQIALLHIAREAAPVGPWIYRVALNAALNALKQRKSRRAHELRRAAMTADPPPPDDAVEAVHQAIAQLDDDHRAAVLQHFFERRTLEDIARDQRCSAVAIWKRIEKSKTSLRESLARSSFLAFIDPVLDGAPFAAAPPGLVTEALVSRAALIAGGIAVTKTFSLAAVVAVALVLFLTAMGGGYFLRANPPAPPEPVAVGTPPPPTVAKIATPTAPAPIATPAPVRVEPVKEPLLSRLQAFAALLREQPTAMRKGDVERHQALERQGRDAWREIRAQIYEEPAVFFAFLRSPENKDIFNELLRHLADAGGTTYPQAVVDGLVDLIATGTRVQRRETATYVSISLFDAGGAGPALTRTCFERLSVEKDPDVLGTLINQLHIRADCTPKIEARLDLLRTLWDNNPDWNVREQCLETLVKATTPVGDAMFLEKMDEAFRGSNQRLQTYLPQILRARLPAIQPADEDRYLPLFATAFRTVTESRASMAYAAMALQLTLPKVQIILADAQANSPDPETRAACERVVTLIRGGETRSDLLFQSFVKKP